MTHFQDLPAEDLSADVLVVGLGPVGAVLAALLGQAGRSVIVVESQHDVYPLPRAAHVDHEVMRIFQAIGIVDAIAPHVRVAPDYEFRAADGSPLIRIDREGVMGVSGWPLGFNTYQPGIERAVRDRLVVIPNVRVLLGTRFLSFEQAEDGVMTLVDGEDVGERHIRSAFVIGCDGAWSPVRQACGIALDDYDFDEPWLVLDTIVADEAGFPPINLQICDPERPTTFVHMGPGRLRWEFMLKPGEDPDAMRQPESIDALLARWRTSGDIAVERTAVYRFHGLVAQDWRRGRVLLAGDAAHQMPPFMGQGMCSGMRDTANLAWKIDAVLDGAGETLLDTYQTERDPHVRFVIERAIAMGRVVCTLDPAAAAIRDARMRTDPQAHAPAPFPTIHGMTLDDTAAAGGIFPQPVSDAGRRLDDALGSGAWLIHRGGNLPPTPAAGLRAIDLDREVPPAFAAPIRAWLAGQGATAVLVRPDRYVFGTGEPDRLVAAWRRTMERIAA